MKTRDLLFIGALTALGVYWYFNRSKNSSIVNTGPQSLEEYNEFMGDTVMQKLQSAVAGLFTFKTDEYSKQGNKTEEINSGAWL